MPGEAGLKFAQHLHEKAIRLGVLSEDGRRIDREKVNRMWEEQVADCHSEEAVTQFVNEGKKIATDSSDTGNCLNVDSVFEKQARMVNRQLKAVSYTLHSKARDLYNGKGTTNLHSMYQKTKDDNRADLIELSNYLKSHDEVVDERREALKRICIEHNINSPLLGKELYDPNKFDKTRD